MFRRMVCRGAKDITGMMCMMASGVGLIDKQAVHSHEMKCIFGQHYVPSMLWGLKNIPKRLKADVIEKEDSIVVALEVPGVEKEDIDIMATEDDVCIKAKKVIKCCEDCEDQFDLFSSDVKLPCGIKVESSKASLHNGILTITLPKETVTMRTKIEIEA